jgi:NAD(P)-dependent dehydrogenase (short-subunit alcohol dehydrogenase family)
VTGAASGIGLATARRLIEEGARVALVDVNADGVAAAAAELDAVALPADVCDLPALERACAEAAERLGGLRVLVNNAGAGQVASVDRMAPADFERIVRVNLTGAWNALRAAAPFLREAGGAVVNNASLSGVRATRGESAYSAAKAGLVSLTQAAALELAPRVRVNCVSPGVIRTALTEPLFRMEGMVDSVLRATPLERAGRAEEVAAVIVFLASDQAAYVTGQNWIVDGGLGLPQAGTDAMLSRVLDLVEPARAPRREPPAED